MLNHLQTNFIRLLFLGTLAFILVSYPAIAQDNAQKTLYNKVKKEEKPKSKILKSARWNTPKKEDKAVEKESTKTPIEDLPTKEITEDQKLWKKYKALADGTNKKEKETTEISVENNTKPEEAQETKKEEKEESSTGITAIIENYKNANKNKGKMNSRSFGKID